MILGYPRQCDWILVALCIVFIAEQMYLDLRILEYMSDITDCLQTDTATDTIVDDGKWMLVCVFVSLALALFTAVMVARTGSSLCSRLRSLFF